MARQATITIFNQKTGFPVFGPKETYFELTEDFIQIESLDEKGDYFKVDKEFGRKLFDLTIENEILGDPAPVLGPF